MKTPHFTAEELQDPVVRDQLAQELLEQFNSFQIRYIAAHPGYVKFDTDERFADLSVEMKFAMKQVWDKVVELAQSCNAKLDCYIRIGTRFPRLTQEYMVFGHLDDEDAFWDLVEAYELDGWLTRVRKKMFECPNDAPQGERFGWFFFVCSAGYDSEVVQEMLENYRRKLCFRYKGYQELAEKEAGKVLEEMVYDGDN